MKKLSIILVVIAFIYTSVVYAQKTSFGITAGITIAKVQMKAEDISMTSDSKTGLTAGIVANVPFGAMFSFQPAINYVQKGGKTKDENYEGKLTSHYIEIPFNILFKPEMKKVQFFAGAGPSVAAAVSAIEKETENGNTYTYKYKFGNDPDKHDMRRFEFGANFITGIETEGGFLIAINYNLGLSNIAPGNSEDGTIKNRYWGFKIGYMLKNKK